MVSTAAVKWPQATEGNCCVTCLCDSLTGGVGQGGRLGGGGRRWSAGGLGGVGGGGARGAMGTGGGCSGDGGMNDKIYIIKV